MSSNGQWIRLKRRIAIYTRDGWRCVWCLASVALEPTFSQSKATLDHVLPRSEGGSNLSSNLVTSCLSCNSRRQDKTPEAFAYELSRGSIERLVKIVGRVCKAMGSKL